MSLYRCDFRPLPGRRARSAVLPTYMLVEAESAAVARRLLAPYATLMRCKVTTVTPAAHAQVAAA